MPRRGLWVVALALVVGFGLAQLPALAAMRAGGTDVVGFEMVATTQQAELVLAGWGEVGQAAARTQLLLDFGFLVGYGLLMWLTATALRAPRLALLGPVAAVADALENIALLVIVGGRTAQPWPALATTFAIVKFVALTAWLVGVAATVVRQRRTR